MIIIGTYPDTFASDDLSENKLFILHQTLNNLLPHNLCLHIFPFYPNSGDYGFAPDDWFHIRPDLGTWDDLSNLASDWKVIVDGIYNHVGVNHEWVRNFNKAPEYYEKILHAYTSCIPSDGPKSPRGQPVLVKADCDYYFWKTFSEAAVDIRLECGIVQEKVEEHLSLLSSIGVWGVRLDAVVYYSKFLGSEVRHNPGVYEIANLMADKIRSYNLKTLAQLDCDEDGLRYFADDERSDIPVNDFTYSTYLALSILEEDPEILVNYIARTKNSKRLIVRVPRTHDGILLRSKLLSKRDKKKIIDFAESHKIKVRVTNKDPYELNCSAPYLYSLLNKNIEVHETILFTLAVTGMVSGWSYFYLPYLIGHIPENDFKQDEFSDPRALNRTPVDKNTLERYLNSDYSTKTYSLLKTLNTIHLSQGENFNTNCLIDGPLLILTTTDNKYSLIANYSKSKKSKIPEKHFKGEVLEKNGLNASTLNCFGFVIMSLA